MFNQSELYTEYILIHDVALIYNFEFFEIYFVIFNS